MDENIRVLIADDMEIIAKSISNILDRIDFINVVGIAHNGTDEYEKILELKPNLVLTDNQMPELNGIDVVDKINSLGLENMPKFVLITGDVDFELSKRSNELGIFKVINKPIDPVKIEELILDFKALDKNKVKHDTMLIKTEKKNNIWKKFLQFLKKLGGKNERF